MELVLRLDSTEIVQLGYSTTFKEHDSQFYTLISYIFSNFVYGAMGSPKNTCDIFSFASHNGSGVIASRNFTLGRRSNFF